MEKLKDKNVKTDRELKTIKSMIAIYCKDNHHEKEGNLCKDCNELFECELSNKIIESVI